MRAQCCVVAFALVAVPCASAGVLYSTNFESFAAGTVNNQFGWDIQQGPDSHGQIVDTGSNRFLRVAATGGGFGAEVRRAYDTASSHRYVQAVLDFSADDISWPFWFMDNNSNTPGDSPDSIFWEQTIVYSANGSSSTDVQLNTWKTIGIEIDTQARQVIGVNFGGVWHAETDSTVSQPASLSILVFRGMHFNTQAPDALYWLSIDNLNVTDSDTPVTPAPGSVVALGIAGMVLAQCRRR